MLTQPVLQVKRKLLIHRVSVCEHMTEIKMDFLLLKGDIPTLIN